MSTPDPTKIEYIKTHKQDPRGDELLALSKQDTCPDPECSGYMDWYWLDGTEEYMCDVKARHVGAVQVSNTPEMLAQRRKRLLALKKTTPAPARFAATVIMAVFLMFVILLIIGGCVAIIHSF